MPTTVARPRNKWSFWKGLTLAASLSVAAVPSLLPADEVPAPSTPLPSNPDFVTGTLPNGLKYVLKKHAKPEGRVALMLQVNSGSLNERDDQQGLAHFLEHMAFNGSKNFKPGDLIPFFEKLGLQFGRHQNAFTSFDQTAYILDMPRNDADSVKDALLCLSDMGFNLLLLPEEIDKERGIINEEARTGKGADQRIQEKLWPQLMPGARLPMRFPIGKEEVFMKAPRQAFVDYYETWYRPESMTLYVFGDIDPALVKPMLADLFGGPAKRPQVAEAPSGVTPYTAQKAIVVTDPEKRGCDIEMTSISAPLPPTTTYGDFRARQIEGMASAMLSKRFDELLNKGEAPFQNAGFSIGSFLQQACIASASASCKPEDWQATAQTLAAELRRAQEHGFVQAELDDMIKDTLASAEAAIPREATTPSMAYVQRVSGAMREGDTVMSAQQRFDALKAVLPTISLADVNAAFRSYADPSRMAFTLTMQEGGSVPVPSDEELLSAFRAALAMPVTPYTKAARPDSLLSQAPKAGAVKSTDVASDLGVTSAALSNGVVIHHKFNDTRKNSVTVAINIAGGTIEETAANRGITEAAIAGWNQTATSALDSTTIRDLMVGKNVSVGAGDGQDSISLNVSGTPKDLEAGLQLAYLMLTDPVIEQAAFDNWKKSRLTQLEGEKFDPGANLRKNISAALSDDPRRQPVTADNVNALTRDDAQAWLSRIIKSGAIEVAVVGDVSDKDAMPLALTYLGSIPARSADFSALNALRKMPLKLKDGAVIDATYDAQAPVAIGLSGFLSTDASNVTEKRLMQVASMIMSTRTNKTIREEKQLVYSIGASSAPAEIYPGSGFFLAAAPCDPRNAAELVKVASEMFAEFAASGPTADEVSVAVGQILEQLENDVKEPQYWMGRLAKLNMRGRSLDECRGEADFYKSVTPDQIKAVFSKYCIPANQVKITVVPKS